MLEVVGERELDFFPGTAVGSAYKGAPLLSLHSSCVK